MPCAFHAMHVVPFSEPDSLDCQFSVSDSSLIKVDQKMWCAYHCPMLDQTGRPTKKATWNEREHRSFREEIERLQKHAIERSSLLNLTGVVFPGKVEFRNVEIPAVSFYQVTFTDHVWFSGSTFTSNATFEAATFIDGARFNETIFNGHAWFKETTFNGDASFEGTTFKRLAWFEETTFNGDASFQAATFIACARFDETIFKGHARFDKTTFTRQASFDETTFNGEAWFEETTFNGDVSFPSSGNTYGGEEVKAKVFPCANFQGAFFGGSVSFVNRRFLQPTVFRHCVFERAPEFHGCTLHQGTVFPPRQNFKDVTSEGAAQAYRTLKLAMEQTRSRQEEAMFFALEQASHRAQKTTPWSIQILSFLYEKAANYGESFLRPLGWLAMTTFIFIILYCVFSYDPTNKIWHLMESVQFAMEQLVRPFSAWLPNGGIAIKAILGNKSSAVLGLQILSTAQALVSLSLITLFILAVRRRFRLG